MTQQGTNYRRFEKSNSFLLGVPVWHYKIDTAGLTARISTHIETTEYIEMSVDVIYDATERVYRLSFGPWHHDFNLCLTVQDLSLTTTVATKRGAVAMLREASDRIIHLLHVSTALSILPGNLARAIDDLRDEVALVDQVNALVGDHQSVSMYGG